MLVLKFIDIVFSCLLSWLSQESRGRPTEAQETINRWRESEREGMGDLVEEAAAQLPEVPTRVIN